MSSGCDMPGDEPAEALPPVSPGKAGSSNFFEPFRRLKLVVLASLLLLVVGAWMSRGGPKRWLHRWRSPVSQTEAARQGVLGSEGAGGGAALIELAAIDEARLVPDDSGWIAEAVLNYTPDYEAQVGSSYADLFAKLSGEVRLQICCPSQDAVDQFVTRWGSLALSGGREVVLINLNRPLSLWPRDRWIARQTSQWLPARNFVPTALSMYLEDKQNDLLVPTLLWPTGLVPGNTLISFHLEGGNLLANGRHVFAGINVFSENQDRFVDEPSMSQVLGKLFGLSPVLVSDRQHAVPWAHADMYLTLLDEQTVLVADLRAGLQWYDSSFLGHAEEKRRETEEPWSGRGMEVNREEGLQESLDDIAAQMIALGYKVHRMPALVAADLGWMITYNNVLLDYRGGERVVFMPVYQLADLDQAAAGIYRQFGLEVRTIDVENVYELGGAVRCLVNVTRRYPEDAPAPLKSSAYQGTLQFYEVGTPPEAELERANRVALEK